MPRNGANGAVSPPRQDQLGGPDHAFLMRSLSLALFALAAIALLMAAHGDGLIFLWAGVAMAGVGVGLRAAALFVDKHPQ